jgi:hypothetical protein
MVFMFSLLIVSMFNKIQHKFSAYSAQVSVFVYNLKFKLKFKNLSIACLNQLQYKHFIPISSSLTLVFIAHRREKLKTLLKLRFHLFMLLCISVSYLDCNKRAATEWERQKDVHKLFYLHFLTFFSYIVNAFTSSPEIVLFTWKWDWNEDIENERRKKKSIYWVLYKNFYAVIYDFIEL